MSSSILEGPTPFRNQESEKPSGVVSPKENCGICSGMHHRAECKRCGGEISNTLKCQPCEMDVQKYVIPRVCCSCGEANWKEIQTGTKHVSEEIIQKDLGALSNSSGRKSKEAQASAGVASKKRCGICSANHIDVVCPFHKLYVPPDTQKYCCEICYGQHLDSVCSFREFVPEGATVSPLYSITCSICGTVISKEQQKCPRCKPRPGCTVIRIATRNACFCCDNYRHEADACPHNLIETVGVPSPMLIPIDELGEPTSPPIYVSEEEP